MTRLLATCLAIAVLPVAARAQVTTQVVRDGTQGPDASFQPQRGADGALEVGEELGARPGGGVNLFHSFERLSIGTGDTLRFSADPARATENVISRVTGGIPSEIDGTLSSSIAGADLWLINPAGVTFGPGGRLDVEGSFHASTASSLQMLPEDPAGALTFTGDARLASASPLAFGFLSSPLGLRIQGSELVVPEGETLGFSGGEIQLRPGSAGSSSLHAPGGRIALIGVEPQAVLSLGAASGAAAIELSGGVSLSTQRCGGCAAEAGGGIALSTEAELPALAPGDIALRTAGDVSLRGKAQPGAGVQIATLTTSAAPGGRIEVDAGGRVQASGATLQASTQGSGRAGSVQVSGDEVLLTNKTAVKSSTLGKNAGSGPGGDLLLHAAGDLVLRQEVDVGVESQSRGNAGTARLEGREIRVENGSRVQGTARWDGAGGSVVIDAAEGLAVVGTDGKPAPADNRGSRITVASNFEAKGDAGSISIRAPRVVLDDGARISSSTSGVGRGGPIAILADESVEISGQRLDGEGSGIRASTEVEPEEISKLRGQPLGDAGPILVQTPRLVLNPGTEVVSNTALPGRGGDVELDVAELVADRASIQARSTGEAGFGSGDAGNVFIGLRADPADAAAYTTQLVSLRGSSIETSAAHAGGGDITIRGPGSLRLAEGSAVDASDTGGEGGNVRISMSRDVVVGENGRILARAAIPGGEGGIIEISTDAFIASPSSQVEAENQVIINSPETDVEGELVALPGEFLDPQALLRPTCAARARADTQGSFTVAERAVSRPAPEEMLLAFSAPDAALEAAGALPSVASGPPQTPAPEPDAADRGLDAFERELAEAKRSGDPTHATAAAARLVAAAFATGQADEAEQTLRRAAALAAAEQPELASALWFDAGNLLSLHGRFAAAQSAYAAAEPLSRSALNRARILASAARADSEAGDPESAWRDWRRASELARSLESPLDRARVQLHLGRSARELAEAGGERRREALLASQQALEDARALAREAGDDRLLSHALGELGALYAAENRQQEALFLTRGALAAAERADAPDIAYRWHWQEGRLHWAAGEADAAVRSYRRALDGLEHSHPELRWQSDASELRFRRAVAPLYLDLVDALLRSSDRVEASRVAPLLVEARSTVERLKAAELRDYFRDECVAEAESQAVDLDRISRSAAIVYPILLPDRIELLVSLPAGLRRFTVEVPRERALEQIDAFRRDAQSRATRRWRASARTLHRWLVEPFEQELAAQHVDTLVFVPDGPLHGLPLAALYDGERFLVERYAIALTQGLSLIAPEPLEGEHVSMLLAGLSESVDGFPPLPYVPAELEAVQKLRGGAVLLDAQFQQGRVEQELDTRRPSVLHIASHAVFTGDPDSSFLLTHDGRLTMEHLASLVGRSRFDRPLELLTLSACETAAGDERAALGLAGIAIRAGARSALGTLWSISDEATTELISAFYGRLGEAGVSKAAALQQAQLRLLHDERFAHPYYWSGFLLISNWL